MYSGNKTWIRRPLLKLHSWVIQRTAAAAQAPLDVHMQGRGLKEPLRWGTTCYPHVYSHTCCWCQKELCVYPGPAEKLSHVYVKPSRGLKQSNGNDGNFYQDCSSVWSDQHKWKVLVPCRCPSQFWNFSLQQTPIGCERRVEKGSKGMVLLVHLLCGRCHLCHHKSNLFQDPEPGVDVAQHGLLQAFIINQFGKRNYKLLI